MRIAHLILTFKDPYQTERMIKRLSHENFDFYIHVDKKFDIQSHLFLGGLSNVFFIKNRTTVNWAGFSTVLATFECIKEIVASGIQYDFINFMSGQDYPIKSPAYINDFFSRNAGKEFISYRDIKNDWTEGLIRMQRYFLSGYHFIGKYRLETLINKILPRKNLPYGLHPYGGSMFWMLSPEAAMYVVNKVADDKALKKFFSLSWASDEFVFQTMLLNSEYRDKIINNTYRYIDWSVGGAHPRTLDKSDAEKLLKSDKLFARKFDMVHSAEILDIIDEYIPLNGELNSYKDI